VSTATTSRHRDPVPSAAKTPAKIAYDLLRGDRRPSTWYDAADVDGQLIESRAIEGSTGVAQLGSTTGSDTNDPLRPLQTGRNYVYFPNTTNGNQIAVPTPIYPTPSTRSEWVFRRIDPQTNGGQSFLTWHPSNRCYIIVASTGVLAQFDRLSDGASSNVSIGLESADTKVWLRVWIDWPAGASGKPTLTVYYSDEADVFDQDGVTWVLAGSTVSPIDMVTPVTTSGLSLNGPSDAVSSKGGLYSVRITHNDGADVQLDLNMNRDTVTQTAITDATGRVCPVNRSATGLKTAIVTRPVMLLDSVDDYIQLPASDTPTFTATTGKHTAVVMYRSHDNPAGARVLLDSRAGATSGWSIAEQLAAGAHRSVLYGADGFETAVTPARTADSGLQVVASVIDDGSLVAYHHETGFGSPGDVSGVGAITYNPPRVGTTAYGLGGLPAVEIFAVLLFKDQALTETELDAIAAELIAGDYP
jgi:hypothetical protein